MKAGLLHDRTAREHLKEYIYNMKDVISNIIYIYIKTYTVLYTFI